MRERELFEDPEGRFRLRLPEGWVAAGGGEEGGVLLSAPAGAGSLHLLGFDASLEEPSDPAEELYAFLLEQEVELEEDEVEDVELEGDALLALCEYLAEEEAEGEEAEEEGEALFWLMGVAAAPGTLVFAAYSCAAGEEAEEREVVRALLASLRLRGSGAA